MFDADMSRRYYLRLSALLTRLEIGLSVITVVLTSGAFLSLAIDSPMLHLTKWSALAVAITSTWLVFSKHGKLAVGFAYQWIAVQAELERLWARRGAVTDAEVHKASARLDKSLSAGIEPLVRPLPLNDWLRRLTHREILKARGMAVGCDPWTFSPTV